MRIVLIAHYFPPINSSGAKRAESLSKYFTELGHEVTVITTHKTRADGAFTESVPKGVRLIELNFAGRELPSVEGGGEIEPMYSGKRSWKRRLKDLVMALLGQIPDPRLPLAFAFLSPWFSKSAKEIIKDADIVIGTTPPWPMVLAAVFCKLRFGKQCILDYRDHFSECHEMPGGPFAKWLEKFIDKTLVNYSDYVVCISEPMSRYYRSISPKVETILNGYDDEVLNKASSSRLVIRDGLVRIRYMGIVSPGRIPYNILNALRQLQETSPDMFNRLRFEFYGTASLIQELMKTNYSSISGIFNFFAPIPYFESLKKIAEAEYVLFSETSSTNTLSAQGILTTKLFEYIGSGRPILGDISKETLAGGLLVQCGEQHIVGQSTDFFLKAMLQPTFYERQSDKISPISSSLSRKAQALLYLELIQKISIRK